MIWTNICSLSILLIITASTYFHAPAQGANILAFLPSTGRSHSKPIYPLLRQLIARGHNVTLFSYFPMGLKTANFTDIVIETKFHIARSIGFANLRSYSRVFNWMYIHDEIQRVSFELAKQHEFQDLLKSSDTRFDLIFAEIYHLDGLSFPLSHRFNCPIIALSFQPMLPIYNWILGNPITFSYIPHVYLPYTDEMSLWQRAANSLFGMFTVLFYNYVSIPNYQKLVDFILQDPQGAGPLPPRIEDLTQNLALVLVESHFSSAYVKPELPNIVNVGGIHIEGLKPLPKDLQNFIDGAEHGVVYVSLGTLIDPQMASELGFKLMNIFEKLPQNVVWKWKADVFQKIPENVLIREWLPQLDILNHPNCKLFISHGGYHSLLEAVYSGVPILGLPFMTDQHYNTAIVQKLGIGIKATPESNQEQLQQAIHSLLKNPSYRQKSQRQSALFKDRLMSPTDTAIYWTEYVLRHKGAPHLKSAASHLYWYQYLLLDIVAALVFAAVTLIYILKISSRIVYFSLKKMCKKSIKTE